METLEQRVKVLVFDAVLVTSLLTLNNFLKMMSLRGVPVNLENFVRIAIP